MAIYAIGDLHLPGHQEKPMNVFGDHWDRHFDVIRENWLSMVSPEDVVLIPGDISWAMQLEEARDDLMQIAALPGRKLLLRGNHDYWWNSISKVRALLPENMYAIQNDALALDGVVYCGTRGWNIPGEGQPTDPQDVKIFQRELLRLEMSLQQAEKLATDFVNGLLVKMGVEGQVKTLPQVECDQLRLEISGPDMGPIIGRRGDTLDAIQYLGSLVLNNALEEHVRLSVDTENYREKRAESLERLARKMAMKVVKAHRSMTLEPMNPYERRIIHAALQDFNGVTTYSTGTEPGRRVVIAPDNSYRNRDRG